MTLRIRLLFGYGYLIGLLLLAAVSAILGFLRLSESVDVVLDDNYATIRASLEMLDGLERQDSATLAALLGDEDRGDDMESYETAFVSALESAEGNVTEAAEAPVVTAIRELFGVYRARRDALIDEHPASPLRAYNEQVFPAFVEVKHKVLQLLEINQQAMLEADRKAKAAAVQNGAWLGFLVAIALVSLVFLSRALQRQLLTRLDELRRGMAAIASGDVRRRLRTEGNDELTQIARHFNGLLDRLQAVEARFQGRLGQSRLTVLGLVERFGGEGTGVYSLSGQLLAKGGGPLGASPPEEVARWIEERGRELLDAYHPGDELPGAGVETAAGDYRLDLLATADERPVGWLARKP